MIQTPFVTYDALGRVTGSGEQEFSFTDAWERQGQRILSADQKYEVLKEEPPIYVDLSGANPILLRRPVLEQIFEKTSLLVRETAVLADVPACTVKITGPWSGTHEHPGGDLTVGFSVPGSYTVAFEAFPAMPFSATLTVEPKP